MESIHVKAYLHRTRGDQIRRFGVPQNVTWAAMIDQLIQLYGAGGYEVRYVDPDGDQVLVSSQEEWEECLSLVKVSAVVYLHLNKQSGRPKRPSENTTKNMLEQQPSLQTCPPDSMSPSMQVLALTQEALVLMQQQQYPQAMDVLLRACDIHVTEWNLYNIACCHTLMGHQDKAIQWLEESVAQGFVDWQHMIADADLEALHSLEEFHDIVRGLQTRKQLMTAPHAHVQQTGTERDGEGHREGQTAERTTEDREQREDDVAEPEGQPQAVQGHRGEGHQRVLSGRPEKEELTPTTDRKERQGMSEAMERERERENLQLEKEDGWRNIDFEQEVHEAAPADAAPCTNLQVRVQVHGHWVALGWGSPECWGLSVVPAVLPFCCLEASSKQ